MSATGGLSRLAFAALAALLMRLEGRLLALAGRVHAGARWAQGKAEPGRD